jgi:hypothetical protein
MSWVNTEILLGVAASTLCVLAFVVGYVLGMGREQRRWARWIQDQASNPSIVMQHSQMAVLEQIVDEIQEQVAGTVHRLDAIEGKGVGNPPVRPLVANANESTI